jgi:hypothetical protein
MKTKNAVSFGDSGLAGTNAMNPQIMAVLTTVAG